MKTGENSVIARQDRTVRSKRLDITPPKVVDGFKQDSLDGVSMAYSFADAKVPGHKHTQYFDNNGSRGVYQDGWFADTFGPLTPWLTVSPGLATWDSGKDVWELYNMASDFSQADNLAAKEPKRLEAMKSQLLKEAKANKVFPIGVGIWLRIHPEDRIKPPYTSWQFDSTTTRMPEFTAPGLGRESNHVVIDAGLGENASGVLYALGGASGGLTLYMDKGDLVYEYNMMIIERRMNGTADRGNFVKFAVLARTGKVAYFRARQAEMYANLHKVTPVERFVGVGTNAAARLANGTVVFCLPLDYLAWTEDNARLAESLDRQVSALPDVRGKEIYIAGGISPNARKGLEDLGWKVMDNQDRHSK